MWDKRSQVVKVLDADTIRMQLDQGFRDTKEIDVRLLGVFAPELRDLGGVQTRDFVADWVARYARPGLRFPFIVTTARGPRSDREITTLERYVATVETIDHSHNLNLDVAAFVTQNGYGGGTGSKP